MQDETLTSMIEWLMSPTCPPIQYLTARNLNQQPALDGDLQTFRQGIREWEPLQQIVRLRQEDGSFPPGQKTPTAQPTFTALTLFQRCALDLSDEPVQRAVDYGQRPGTATTSVCPGGESARIVAVWRPGGPAGRLRSGEVAHFGKWKQTGPSPPGLRSTRRRSSGLPLLLRGKNQPQRDPTRWPQHLSSQKVGRRSRRLARVTTRRRRWKSTLLRETLLSDRDEAVIHAYHTRKCCVITEDVSLVQDSRPTSAVR